MSTRKLAVYMGLLIGLLAALCWFELRHTDEYTDWFQEAPYAR